ncbi:hypothetical protein TIFTF001_009116 [Ficus carica]|uniref:Uncharacterized protein n=1 Tax=Ficus carica TaxID=3494 RepID=A0AA88A680_FICCA|nr:hypothetical protein TIFTF001_009116 [Ficus carica]
MTSAPKFFNMFELNMLMSSRVDLPREPVQEQEEAENRMKQNRETKQHTLAKTSNFFVFTCELGREKGELLTGGGGGVRGEAGGHLRGALEFSP